MNNIYRPFHRPASSCTLPRGLNWEYVEAPAEIAARRPDLPKSTHRFGIIKTDRPLTADELDHFSLAVYEVEAEIIRLSPSLASLGFSLGDVVAIRPTAVAFDQHSTWDDGQWHASFIAENNGTTCTVAEDLHVRRS